MIWTEQDIKDFLKENYNLEVEISSKLDGYIDENYKIKTADDARYILKVSNSDPLYFIEAQNFVMEFLSAKSNLYPSVIRTKNNVDIVPVGNSKVRLLSFLEGDFLEDINHPSDQLLYNFGHCLASMNLSLATVDLPSLSHMHLDWDIQNTLEHTDKLHLCKEAGLKRLIHYFLLQFKEKVVPLIPSLRKSIIHNDANPMNVLVDGDEIIGFIDFGDMTYGCVIFDVAIAVSYLLMETEEPLQIASQFLKGYSSVHPLSEEELSILYYLIAARLCTSQLMALASQQSSPENDYTSVHQQRGINLLHKWIGINPIHAENMFRTSCGFTSLAFGNRDAMLADRKESISNAQSISYSEPIIMTRSALQYMYDGDGNTYLDCVNNIMHVGHCHPVVVEAGQRQMARMNTNTRYLYDNLNLYASELLAKLPNNLTKIFFVNSGSAASDLAVRLAKNFTGKEDLIVIDQGYHGNTEVGIDISPYKFDSKGGAGAKSHIHKIRMPDTYREETSGEVYAKEVEELLNNIKPAAFIGESILGCGGQLMLPDNYFKSIYEKIRKAGGVCIADEVQVGFGRVGSHFWGFQLQDVQPDIVIMGKPIGNGHPLAAVACTNEIAEAFNNGMEFFSSFGGNPVSCDIGRAVLKVIEEEGLQSHAEVVGTYIMKQWNELKSNHACIGDVRGAGLFLGMEFVKSRDTKEPDEALASLVVDKMKEKRFLLSTDGPYHNVMKFKPPMVFSKKNADSLFANLKAVLIDNQH